MTPAHLELHSFSLFSNSPTGLAKLAAFPAESGLLDADRSNLEFLENIGTRERNRLAGASTDATFLVARGYKSEDPRKLPLRYLP